MGLSMKSSKVFYLGKWAYLRVVYTEAPKAKGTQVLVTAHELPGGLVERWYRTSRLWFGNYGLEFGCLKMETICGQ